MVIQIMPTAHGSLSQESVTGYNCHFILLPSRKILIFYPFMMDNHSKAI
ncbi:hypothetical protein Nmel_004747 [Mimus melanotis]